MSNLHISDVPEFKESPIALAFTTYVLATNVGIPYKLTQLTECNIKFGKGVIRYRLQLVAQDGLTYEFFIVKLDDELGMMVQRTFSGDDLIEDSIGLTHYQHKPYSVEGVLKLVRDLPKQAAVTYHACDCSKIH